MYTLIVTAKLNDIDPQAWLADVLAGIGEQGGIVPHGLEQPRLDLREPPRLVFDERGESRLRDAHTIPKRSLESEAGHLARHDCACVRPTLRPGAVEVLTDGSNYTGRRFTNVGRKPSVARTLLLGRAELARARPRTRPERSLLV